MIQYLLQLVIVFVATMCYAVLYHTPKKALVAVGLVGVGAWITQSVITAYGFRPVGSAFFGGLFVAAASEALARRMRMPVIVFVVGGIVPLLPGSSAWATMREFVTGHYNEGVSRGTETFLIAAALSAGLVLAGTIVRLDRRRGTGARKTS
ncbi:MAG: threonine/serine exporter family protein [Tumebacillaceae bacterium]